MIQKVVRKPSNGAEVGVYKGKMSVALRMAFPDCELLFIDPWQAWGPDDSYWQKHRRTGQHTQQKWDALYAEAVKCIQKAGGKNRIMRVTSKWAAKVTDDDSLDFVFIDADHSCAMVKQDIELWSPKIHVGGLLCGHDYGKAQPGVRRAVHEVLGEDQILVDLQNQLWGYVIRG